MASRRTHTSDDGQIESATWNPTTGCDRVSPGCDRCYALTFAARLKAMGNARYQRDGDPSTSGPGFALSLHPDKLDTPLRWARPRLVFVGSMSGLFHPQVPDAFLHHVLDTMARARMSRSSWNFGSGPVGRKAALMVSVWPASRRSSRASWTGDANRFPPTTRPSAST